MRGIPEALARGTTSMGAIPHGAATRCAASAAASFRHVRTCTAAEVARTLVLLEERLHALSDLHDMDMFSKGDIWDDAEGDSEGASEDQNEQHYAI